jgi:hypothetical protein
MPRNSGQQQINLRVRHDIADRFRSNAKARKRTQEQYLLLCIDCEESIQEMLAKAVSEGRYG